MDISLNKFSYFYWLSQAQSVKKVLCHPKEPAQDLIATLETIVLWKFIQQKLQKIVILGICVLN